MRDRESSSRLVNDGCYILVLRASGKWGRGEDTPRWERVFVNMFGICVVACLASSKFDFSPGSSLNIH